LTTARIRYSTPAPRAEEAKPMAIDIKKFFNDELPAALARNADDAKTVGARYQISVTGPTGGDWNVDVSSSGPSCRPGTGPADCTIVVSDEDFQKLIENPGANGMTLFFAGKLKLTGNPMLATKLQKLFSFK
jgi:SCP-2 sterol transfer family